MTTFRSSGGGGSGRSPRRVSVVLEAYLRSLLSEGAWDDAIARLGADAPETDEQVKYFGEFKRLGVLPKFVPLFVKTPQLGTYSPEMWKAVTTEWDAAAKKNLEGFEKDISRYQDAFGLFDAVDSAKTKVSKTQVKKNVKEGARTLYSDKNGWRVLHVTTTEASCEYGKGTKWCISATQSQNYFNQYHKEYRVNTYFVIHGSDKFAIVVYPKDGDNDGRTVEYYDAADNLISEEVLQARLEELGAPVGIWNAIGVEPQGYHPDYDAAKSQVQPRPQHIVEDPAGWLKTHNVLSSPPGSEEFPLSLFVERLPWFTQAAKTDFVVRDKLVSFLYYFQRSSVLSLLSHSEVTHVLGWLARDGQDRDTAWFLNPAVLEGTVQWLRDLQVLKDPRAQVLKVLEGDNPGSSTTASFEVRGLFQEDLDLAYRALVQYLATSPQDSAAQSPKVLDVLAVGLDHLQVLKRLTPDQLEDLFRRDRQFAFVAARSSPVDGPVYDALWGAIGTRSIAPASPQELKDLHDVLETGLSVPSESPLADRFHSSQWWSAKDRLEVRSLFTRELARNGYNVWKWLADHVANELDGA